MIVDSVTLDETNEAFNHAAEFVRHTNKLVYLTGKAGTGKTTFLKYLRKTTGKNMVVVAPTGVAAINAGGQTIHSFFQIKPGVYFPGDPRLRIYPQIFDTDQSTVFDHFKYFREKVDMIRSMQLLVIDEISMVRCDLLDVIDQLLRAYRKREREPFGGVQVLLIGDTFQLPPIADGEQWDILRNFYESPFFFSAKVLKDHKPIYIELKKIYRQNEQDFIRLLNNVRINQVSDHELAYLNQKYDPAFTPPDNENYIVLATHNKIVDQTNRMKLDELPGAELKFTADVSGVFPDNILPTDKELQLKPGAQVMFIKNDRQKRYYNGKICKIRAITDGKIYVDLNGDEMQVEQELWENIRYTWNDGERKITEEVIGSFTQYPIKLAWAVTVHKSQGLTFEKVIADVGGAFSSGQVYVALSRCTTFGGLVLKSRIERRSIFTDPEVLKFALNETPGTLITQELQSGKADTFYKDARNAFKKGDLVAAHDHLLQALSLRNDSDTDIYKRFIAVYAQKLDKKRLERLADKKKQTTDKLRQMERQFENAIVAAKQEKKKLQQEKRDQKRAAAVTGPKN